MKQLMAPFMIGSLCALAACVPPKPPHVPDDLQGDIPVEVANANDAKLCHLWIFPPNATTDDDWLGRGAKAVAIDPNGHQQFKVKPGTYQVLAGFCDASNQLIPNVAAGTYGNETVTIRGQTLLAIGTSQKPAAPGYDVYALGVHTASGGGGAGEAAPAEAAESAPAESSSKEPAQAACKPNGAEAGHFSECCSNRTTGRGTLHNGGRTVCCANDSDCVATP